MSKGRVRTIFLWCSGIAAVVTTLNWLGIRPNKEPSRLNQHGASNVASLGQSAGITANQVAINVNAVPKPPRKLDDQLKKSLLDKLKLCGGKKVEVNALLGNEEAIEFARQITAFLLVSGYEADGVGQSVYEPSPRGNTVHCEESGAATITIIGIQN